MTIAPRLRRYRFSAGSALALGLALCMGAVAAPVTRSVRVSGMAPVIAGDRTAALAEARRAALREAVEEGVGVLVSSATRVENFAVISDQILTRTTGYVQSFTVAEESVDGGVCRVVLDAVVDLRDLHRDLAGLQLALSEIGNPRVVCVGREVEVSPAGDEEVSWGALQAELARAVGQHGGGGFRLSLPADSGAGSGAVSPDDGAAALVVSGVARLTRTRVPIPFGSASLEGAGLLTAVASLEIRVSWSDTDEPVGSVASIGRAASPAWRGAAEQAIRRAVDSVGVRLAAILAEEVRLKAFSPRQIALRVQAPHHLLAPFEAQLPGRLTAIEGLERRAYKDGLGLYDLRGTAAGHDLARSLSAVGLDSMKVEIVHASTNALSLMLSAPDATPPEPQP